MKLLFSNTIKQLDYFAKPIKLSFDKEKKFRTIFGGLLSLLIYGVTFSLFINMGNNLLNKNLPKISSTTHHLIDQPLLNLSNINILFSFFFMTKEFEIFNDPTYFDFYVSKFSVSRTSNKSNFNNRDLDLIKCDQYLEKFKESGFENEYNKNNLKDTNCLELGTEDTEIGGNFAGNFFSNILIRLTKCKNETTNLNTTKNPNLNTNNSTNLTSKKICKPLEEINDKIRGGYFELYYIDKNINIQNFSNPLKRYFSNYFILLDSNSQKFVDIYFKTISIFTDNGLIFESRDVITDVVFDYFREQIIVYDNDNKNIIDFYINSSNNFSSYDRVYMKIQEFAATIGGFIKILLLLGGILNSIFMQTKMHEKMINALFSIETPEKNIFHTENIFLDKKYLKGNKFNHKNKILLKENNVNFAKKNLNSKNEIVLTEIKSNKSIIKININENSLIDNSQNILDNQFLSEKKNFKIKSIQGKINNKGLKKLNNYEDNNISDQRDVNLKSDVFPYKINQKLENSLTKSVKNSKLNLLIKDSSFFKKKLNINSNDEDKNQKYSGNNKDNFPNYLLDDINLKNKKNETEIIKIENTENKFHPMNLLTIEFKDNKNESEGLSGKNINEINNINIKDNTFKPLEEKNIINKFGINQNNFKNENKINKYLIEKTCSENKFEISKKLEKSKNKKNSMLKIQWYKGFRCSLFYKFCPKLKKEFQLYEKALEKSNKYLDFLEITHSLQEHQIMKEVLLSKNKLNLLKVDYKPLLNLEKNSKNQNDNESENLNLKNILISYKIGKIKSNKSKIYKKLIEQMDKNLKRIFDEEDEI